MFNTSLNNALTRANSDIIAGYAMPNASEKFDELTLGTSGSTYTAPANGYFTLCKTSNGANLFIRLVNYGTDLVTTVYSHQSGDWCAIYIPCKAGDKVYAEYTSSGTTQWFRFVYADGDQ